MDTLLLPGLFWLNMHTALLSAACWLVSRFLPSFHQLLPEAFIFLLPLLQWTKTQQLKPVVEWSVTAMRRSSPQRQKRSIESSPRWIYRRLEKATVPRNSMFQEPEQNAKQQRNPFPFCGSEKKMCSYCKAKQSPLLVFSVLCSAASKNKRKTAKRVAAKWKAGPAGSTIWGIALLPVQKAAASTSRSSWVTQREREAGKETADISSLYLILPASLKDPGVSAAAQTQRADRSWQLHQIKLASGLKWR